MKTLFEKTSLAFLNFIITFLISFYVLPADAQTTDSTRAPGVEIRTVYSDILGEKRKIRIQVPESFNNYDAYPVLYLLDGESHTAMVAGQVQYLSEGYKIIPNLIVVSIENTDRMRDLTPVKDTTIGAAGRTSGGAEKFLSFMKDELMPYIESRYKTAPFKILSGHSLGGLVAIHCLVNHPDYFDAYIAISPSLQWAGRAMLDQVAQKLSIGKGKNKFLFFSDANEDAVFHQNQLKLDSILQQKQISNLKFKRLFYPEETHLSEPVKAFYDGIRFIYPNWHLAYNSSAFKKIMSSKIIRDHYEQLKGRYGYNVIPLHDEIILISRFLRNDTARIKDAIELLEMNALNYPASPVAFETLGDTYLKAGNNQMAAANFSKALNLDPRNEKLQAKIKNLNP